MRKSVLTLTKIQHYSRLIALFGFLLAQSLAADHAVDHTINPQHGDCLIGAAFDDDSLEAPNAQSTEQPFDAHSIEISTSETLHDVTVRAHTAIRAPPALLFSQL